MGSALAVLYVAVIVGLLLWNPRAGFLGLFLLRPFVELSRAFPSVAIANRSLAQVVGIVVPLVLVAVLVIRLRGRLTLPVTVFALFAWFTVPAIFGGPNNTEYWLRLVTPLPLLLFPQIVEWSDEQRMQFVKAVFWSLPIVAVSMIIGYTFPALVPAVVQINGEEVLRIAGVFGVPVLTAYWLSIFIIVCAFLFIADSKNRWRPLYLIMGLALLLPFYATFSRMAWVSLAVALAVWLWLRGSRAGVVVLGVASLIVLLAIPGVRERMFAANWGGTSRVVLWGPAFAMYFDASIIEKLFGVGWGNLDMRIWKYLPAGYPFTGTGTTENSLLFLTFGGGIAAGLSYLVFSGDVIRRMAARCNARVPKVARDYAALSIALLILMMLQGMTGDVVLSPVVMWYYYAGIGVALTPRIQQATAAV